MNGEARRMQTHGRGTLPSIRWRFRHASIPSYRYRLAEKTHP